MNGFDVVIAGIGVAGFAFILMLVYRWVTGRTTSTGTGTGIGTTGGTTPPPPPVSPGTTPPPPPITTVVNPPGTTIINPSGTGTTPPAEEAGTGDAVLDLIENAGSRVARIEQVRTPRGHARLTVEFVPPDSVVSTVKDLGKDAEVELESGGGKGFRLTRREAPLTNEESNRAAAALATALRAGTIPIIPPAGAGG